VTADESGVSDAESPRNPSGIPAAIGMMVSLALLLLVQWQLSHTPHPGGRGLAGVVAQLVLHGLRPSEPNVWFQVSAPIAKGMMSGAPPALRQAAEPVIDWLSGTDGIQRAELARIMHADGEFTIDLYGIDEIGCRRIMAATRMPEPWIASIAVTGAAADIIAVPTTAADEKQCDRKTAFLRLVSRLHPAHDQH
jgi:hypothetical protein